MKTIAILLYCCAVLAGCASMVETDLPRKDPDLPRAFYPGPADPAYARTHYQTGRSQWSLDTLDVLGEEYAKTDAMHRYYAGRGLDAKYNAFLLPVDRFADYRMNISQASRLKSEADELRILRTRMHWSAYKYDARATDSTKLGRGIERKAPHYIWD